MPSSSTQAALLDRFLGFLGIDRQEPCLEALTNLVTAYMMRVPFENVSKLYYLKRHGWRRLPDLKTLIDGIERCHFGGTCYSNNYHLHLLLSHLGYAVKLCGADMANPDVHLVNMVSLDGRQYLVDAGYAAPFLQPLPRDLEQDYVIAWGRDRYVLKPQDQDGNSRLELYRNGRRAHGYTAKPLPRTIEHFARVIAESYREEATFMNALLLVRLYRSHSIVIHNLSVIESDRNGCRVHQLTDRRELPMVVEKHFSIPREVVTQVIAGLGEFVDAWN